jgi:hypothetical protein
MKDECTNSPQIVSSDELKTEPLLPPCTRFAVSLVSVVCVCILHRHLHSSVDDRRAEFVVECQWGDVGA